MFCNQCGSPVSEIAIYCTKCGSKLQGNLAGQKVEVEDSSEVILQAETGAVKVSKSKLSKSKWLVLVITTIVIIGAYWYVSHLIAVKARLTQVVVNGNLNCSASSDYDDDQCIKLLNEILPNGNQECDTSMASGGNIAWGGKYNTSNGKPISILLRKGRGNYLTFLPYDSIDCKGLPIKPICQADPSALTKNSSACYGSPNTYLSVGGWGTGESIESQPVEASYISLLVQGGTLYFASENNVAWDEEAKLYRYSRVIYRVSENGAEELLSKSSTKSQLIRLDDALPLDDLEAF